MNLVERILIYNRMEGYCNGLLLEVLVQVVLGHGHLTEGLRHVDAEYRDLVLGNYITFKLLF